jgi:hypothetical protein
MIFQIFQRLGASRRRNLLLHQWLLFGSLLVTITNCNAQDPPRLLLQPENSTVVADTKVSFFCRSDGNPLPKFTWKRNGRTIGDGEPSRFMIFDDRENDGWSSLRVEPVLLSDDRTEISCVAENGNGRPAVGNATLFVVNDENIPEGFPQILLQPQVKAVELGRPAAIRCEVAGNPQPTISWLREKWPVNVRTESRYSIADRGSPGNFCSKFYNYGHKN